MPATKLAQRPRHATGTRIRAYTARNRLRAARLRARRPSKGVPLNPGHIKGARFFGRAIFEISGR